MEEKGWSLIASHLPGRTDNEIKNYWNSHLSRKIYSFRIETNMDTTLPGLTDSPKVAIPPEPKLTDTPKVAIPPKPKPRRGRTSRWAMKKNKSYIQKGNRKPKQIAPHQDNKEVVVPPPPSSLESEVNLCSTIEDFLVLDLDANNNNMVGKEEEPNSNANKDKEGLELGVQCCPMYEQESNDTLLGPYEYDDQAGGVINVGGGALSLFADMVDSFMLEECGVLTSSEESDCNNNNSSSSIVGKENEPKKMAMSSEDQGESSCVNSVSSNGESGDWYLGLDDCCWDWKSLMQLNDGSIDESEACNWEQRENLLAWLWEDDDWERECMKLVGEMDADQKQNDMLAWLLS